MKLYNRNPAVIFATQHRDPFFDYLSGKIFSYVSYVPGKRLLDLGSGTGRNTFIAGRLGFEVIGVDYEPKAVSVGKQYAKKFGLTKRVVFIKADLTKLKKRQFGLFDYIILMEVIEHIDNYQRVLDFAYDSLKKGGTLLLTTPNDPRQWSILDDYAQHKRRLTIRQVRMSLEDFSRANITTIGFPFLRFSFWLYDVLKKFQRRDHNPATFHWRGLVGGIYWLVGKIILFLDDLIGPTPWGTTIIAIAKK